MSGPLCGVAVVAFEAVRCGAADLLFSVHRSVISLEGRCDARASGYMKALRTGLWLLSSVNSVRRKIRWLPRSGVVTIMKLLLFGRFLRFTTGCNRPEADAWSTDHT